MKIKLYFVPMMFPDWFQLESKAARDTYLGILAVIVTSGNISILMRDTLLP